MALDRRITLRVQAEGTFDQDNHYVPGPVTEIPVWASVTSFGSTDTLTESGVIVTTLAQFTFRWRADIAAHPISRLGVGYLGAVWNAETLSESDQRRRALTIQAFRVTQ